MWHQIVAVNVSVFSTVVNPEVNKGLAPQRSRRATAGTTAPPRPWHLRMIGTHHHASALSWAPRVMTVTRRKARYVMPCLAVWQRGTNSPHALLCHHLQSARLYISLEGKDTSSRDQAYLKAAPPAGLTWCNPGTLSKRILSYFALHWLRCPFVTDRNPTADIHVTPWK
jgi:hypothetical protein